MVYSQLFVGDEEPQSAALRRAQHERKSVLWNFCISSCVFLIHSHGPVFQRPPLPLPLPLAFVK